MALRQERVAQRLVELRERHDLSQEKAAQKVGITHRQWQRWENGESPPRAGKLGEIALAFGVPLAAFYDDEPEIAPGELAEIVATLKQLVERQEALEGAVTAMAELLAERLPPAQPRRRRAS